MSKKFVSAMCIMLSTVMLLGLMMSSISALAVTQSEIDALEAQRDAIRDKQKVVSEQLQSLRTDRETVMERKAALDEQNELKRQDIELINEQIELYSGLIAAKEIEVLDAQEAEQTQYERYCRRVRAMEESDNWSYISFIFKATSFSDLLARLDDVMDIVTRDQDVEAEYIAAREALEQVKIEYEDIQGQQEAKKDELELQKRELEGQIEAAGALISQLEEDIDTYTSVYEKAEADKANIQSQIDQKAAELKRQQEAAAAAAAAASNSTNSGGTTASGGTSSNTATATSTATTTTSNGYYQWPSYCTYITSRCGYRIHPVFKSYKYHSGVDIAATYGTTITAAASGTVTMAGSSSGYGNYVTIYHDNGTTTLYAHMSSTAVSTGQTVTQGQAIGYVGSTGTVTAPHLHFEVRVNGACVDPMQYFGGGFTYSASA